MSGIEILDSEMLEIEQVMNSLKDKTYGGRRLDRGQFDSEIQERFGRIGFKVHVLWYETDEPDMIMPEITIVDRTEKVGEFDHDKMFHEVTSDILGLGQGGVIKTTKDDLDKIHGVTKAHKHGSGCGH